MGPATHPRGRQDESARPGPEKRPEGAARAVTSMVSVGVLNHNGRRWLPGCLDSLARTDYPALDVTVIDNGSTDGSQELLRATYPRVGLLSLERNVGFAAAYNRFIEGASAPFALLLNNDTVAVEPSWIRVLVAALERDSSVAAATCKMLYLRHPERLNSVGGQAYWWTGSFDIGDGERDQGQYDDPPIEPFAFCGGAAMVRVAAVREAGGFDEGVFAYREDFDLSWRLRLRGYRIVYVPEARVLHAGGAAWGPVSYGKLYLSSRNWLRSMLKNYAVSTLWRALPAYLALELTVRLAGLIWITRSPRHGLIPFHNLLWNATFLADTLRARREVQAFRRVSDSEILRAMGPGGFEPLTHLRRRARLLQETAGSSSFGQHA